MSTTTSKTKDATFKARIRHNHGCDQQLYDDVVEYKKTWEKNLFYYEEEQIQQIIQSGQAKQLPILDVNIPDLVEEHLEGVGELTKELAIILGKDGQEKSHIIPFGELIDLKEVSRKGLIFNTGGTITSLKWLPVPLTIEADVHYLAVSTIYNSDGLEKTINNPELSIFKQSSGTALIRSTIQIWKYNLQTNTINIDRVYDTTLLGATQNLKWAPLYVENKDILGVLAGTFTDGKLHLFKINAKSNGYTKLAKPSFSYSPESCFNKDFVPSFTSFDFLGSDKVIVGTNDGNIAEFVLPFSDEVDLHIPSYVQRAVESSVTFVFVVDIEPGKYLVYINSSGTDIVAYEYLNFLQDRVVPSAKPVFKPTVNPRLNMVLYPHSADLMAFSFYRSVQDLGNFLLKVEGFLSAIEQSEILGHPLSLTGTSSGDVIVLNHTRKYLHGSKTSNKVLTPLLLWKLSYNNNNLKLNANYEVLPVELTQQHPISPHQVLISHLAWNENLTGSSVYTVGSMSGLVILERLDPKYA